MPSYIFFDWDVRELRAVAATLAGRGARIEQVVRVAWTDAPPTDLAGWTVRGAKLKEALREQGVVKGEAFATVPRSAVELKPLSLPPAPDEELPDLVRFQAQREFHNLGPDTPFDFRPSPAAAGEPRSVLAAAVDPLVAAQVRALCEGAGLRLRRMLLRPCAAASLVVRDVAADDVAVRLLVEAAADEAEVTALAGREPVLVRSARLPGDPQSAEYGRALTSELRRTTASVQHQLGGRRVDRVCLFGAADEWPEAVARVGGNDGPSIDAIDPWARLPSSIAAAPEVIDRRGRFAPLLGALVDEVETTAPAFDFNNPRRAPAPPDHRRRAAVLATVAVAAAIALWAVVAGRLSSLDDEIAATRRQAAALEPALKAGAEVERRDAELEKWLRGGVVWLTEFERLARRLPPAEQAMLTQLRVAAHAAGGEMQLAGVVADVEVGDALEHELRDALHAVEGKGRRRDPDGKRYPWRFQSSVVVRHDPAAPTKPAEPKQPADGGAANVATPAASATGGR